MRTLLIVAGEHSGDIHGASLAIELRKLRPDLRILGTGGASMRAAGVEILHDPTRHASIGVVEAIRNFGGYAKMYRLLTSTLRSKRPDGVVLIDSPDFNLRYAERVRDAGIPVVYYISPQIWAWRKSRVKTVKRLVDRMIVVFDFEERFYREAGVPATFVGHPLLDGVKTVDRADFRRKVKAQDLLIGLLPGSRRRQFGSLMPLMLKAAGLIRQELPSARFAVACAPTIGPERVEAFRAKSPVEFTAVWDKTPEVLASSDALIVASGTATLEAAIYGTPMVVTYLVNPIMALTLGPLLLKNVKHLAMPNIIAGKTIVPELYQFKAKAPLIAREVVGMIKEGRLPQIRKELGAVRERLGSPGASRRAAEECLRTFKL